MSSRARGGAHGVRGSDLQQRRHPSPPRRRLRRDAMATDGDGRGDPERSRRPARRLAPHGHLATEAEASTPDYVRLADAIGGVVVSGNVNSPMPAWSAEVGGPLNVQPDRGGRCSSSPAGRWRPERTPPRRFPIRSRRASEVFNSAGCVGCHGAQLMGSTVWSEHLDDRLRRDHRLRRGLRHTLGHRPDDRRLRRRPA